MTDHQPKEQLTIITGIPGKIPFPTALSFHFFDAFFPRFLPVHCLRDWHFINMSYLIEYSELPRKRQRESKWKKPPPGERCPACPWALSLAFSWAFVNIDWLARAQKILQPGVFFALFLIEKNSYLGWRKYFFKGKIKWKNIVFSPIIVRWSRDRVMS